MGIDVVIVITMIANAIGIAVQLYVYTANLRLMRDLNHRKVLK